MDRHTFYYYHADYGKGCYIDTEDLCTQKLRAEAPKDRPGQAKLCTIYLCNLGQDIDYSKDPVSSSISGDNVYL